MANELVELEFDLPLRDARELEMFIRHVLGVRIPNTHVCPNHCTPFEALADAVFGANEVMVIKASRGLAGKTVVVATIGAVVALTLAVDGALLGGSSDQSENILKNQQKFWQHAGGVLAWEGQEVPRMDSGNYVDGDPLASITRFTAGNTLTALTASEKSVRGGHAPLLVVDEADEVKISLIDSALGMPQDQAGMGGEVVRARSVLSSTWQHPNGTMTELIKRARLRHGWKLYTWCYRECLTHEFVAWRQDDAGRWELVLDYSRPIPGGWLTKEQVERKRRTMSVVAWDTEVEDGEPSPESRAFDPRAVAAMFRRDLGENMNEDEWAVCMEEPVAGAVYALGADWARAQDWSVFVVLRVDEHPYRVVYVERAQREGWKTIIARFDAVSLRYNINGAAAHDATGIGDVIDQYLETLATGVVMRGNPRTELFSDYILAVEHGNIVSPFISYFEDAHRRCSRDDLFGAGHPPDEVVAASMAYKAAAWAQPITMP